MSKKKSIIMRLMDFYKRKLFETGKPPEIIYMSEELYEEYSRAVSYGSTQEERRKRGLRIQELVYRDSFIKEVLI